MDRLYIVIPAYNEEENIRQVIEDWYPVIERHSADGTSRLVIIDDGSRDRTGSLLKEYQKEYPMLEAVSKKNEGHGATVMYGYRYALKHGADYIFQTDSDGQTLPQEFEPFWKERKKYDFQIGYRHHRQDGRSRIFVTKVLRLIVRIVFKVSARDVNTPYRLMSAVTLKKVLEKVPERFNLSNVLISVIYLKDGYRTRYLPITFRPRQGGVNSVNFRKIFRIGWQALRDFMKIERTLENKK